VSCKSKKGVGELWGLTKGKKTLGGQLSRGKHSYNNAREQPRLISDYGGKRPSGRGRGARGTTKGTEKECGRGSGTKTPARLTLDSDKVRGVRPGTEKMVRLGTTPCAGRKRFFRGGPGKGRGFC